MEDYNNFLTTADSVLAHANPFSLRTSILKHKRDQVISLLKTQRFLSKNPNPIPLTPYHCHEALAQGPCLTLHPHLLPLFQPHGFLLLKQVKVSCLRAFICTVPVP